MDLAWDLRLGMRRARWDLAALAASGVRELNPREAGALGPGAEWAPRAC